MITNAESEYSVKTATISEGLEDTFSTLLGMDFNSSKASSSFRKSYHTSVQDSRLLGA